jgi:hypothetical protein
MRKKFFTLLDFRSWQELYSNKCDTAVTEAGKALGSNLSKKYSKTCLTADLQKSLSPDLWFAQVLFQRSLTEIQFLLLIYHLAKSVKES